MPNAGSSCSVRERGVPGGSSLIGSKQVDALPWMPTSEDDLEINTKHLGITANGHTLRDPFHWLYDIRTTVASSSCVVADPSSCQGTVDFVNELRKIFNYK